MRSTPIGTRTDLIALTADNRETQRQRFMMIDRTGRVVESHLSGPAIGTAFTGYFGEYYLTETELRRVLP